MRRQIPSMYYDKPYYLSPTKGGDKVYTLLRQALESTRKVAVATFVFHQRQHLCAIAPQGASLMLLTLRFADEVLPAAEPRPAKGQRRRTRHGQTTGGEHGGQVFRWQIQGYLPGGPEAPACRKRYAKRKRTHSTWKNPRR